MVMGGPSAQLGLSPRIIGNSRTSRKANSTDLPLLLVSLSVLGVLWLRFNPRVRNESDCDLTRRAVWLWPVLEVVP